MTQPDLKPAPVAPFSRNSVTRLPGERVCTGGGPLVLVASADPVSAAALTAELHAFDCSVVVVKSVIDAITELHGVEYDVALVAFSLPPRTGADVVRVARELSPETEVVVILDPGREDAPVDCVRHGAFDFLHQPINTHEVEDVLERAMNRRALRTSTAMFRASHAILSGTKSAELPRMMVDLSLDLLAADGVTLYRSDRSGRLAVANEGGSTREGDAAELLAIARQVAKSGASATPLLVPEDGNGEEVLAGTRIRSAIVCPILLDGQLAGVLAAYRSRDPRPFRRGDAERAGVFASQLRLAFDNELLLAKTVVTERLAAVGELAAGVAHEINNPLTYVLNSCDAALCEIDDLGIESAELRQILTDLQEGADRIRVIARDLRTLSRGTAEAEQFDLGDAIRSALRIAAPSLRGAVDVKSEMESGLSVVGSPGRACQVFVNLLVNAAQAAVSCKPRRVGLSIEARRQGERLVTTVRDTGPGIPAENLGRIFEAFFTTKPSETGTGLGLSITRTIIEDHGGTIAVESTVGEGTTFTIDLPFTAEAASGKQSAA